MLGARSLNGQKVLKIMSFYVQYQLGNKKKFSRNKINRVQCVTDPWSLMISEKSRYHIRRMPWRIVIQQIPGSRLFVLVLYALNAAPEAFWDFNIISSIHRLIWRQIFEVIYTFCV